MTITYRKLKRYKYQTLEDITFELPAGFELPEVTSSGGWVTVSSQVLTILRGYCWNGTSGTRDTKASMRGSLGHDAIYQLMREGLIPQIYRKFTDVWFLGICEEDGTGSFMLWGYRFGLRFAGFAAALNEGPEIVRITAP